MDIQLLAIAVAIILIAVILVGCFLFVGTRERTFEDALAEQQGLNLLLAKDTDSSQTAHKKHQKDSKKKKVSSVKEPPKKEVGRPSILPNVKKQKFLFVKTFIFTLKLLTKQKLF